MPHETYNTDNRYPQIDSATIKMMPPEPRLSERPSSYTMRTNSRSQVGSSHSQTQIASQPQFRANKTSSTPLASPIQPFSVGQPYPPKLSPSANGNGLATATQIARTPNPDYFGLSIDDAIDPPESAVLPRENWSPQTSSVKSFGAAIPKQMPLDANPEFEAFRRQADANRGRGFSLSQFSGAISGTPLGMSSTPSAVQRPRPPRWHTTHGGNESTDYSFPRMPPIPSIAKSVEGAIQSDVVTDKSSAQTKDRYVGTDAKPKPAFALNPSMFLNMDRRQESPFNFDPSKSPAPSELRRQNHGTASDAHSRLSMSHDKAAPSSPHANQQSRRADTVPTKPESDGPGMMSAVQLEELMEHTPQSDVLILDLRVSPQYAQSRIKGALNLCIPTTLLKRATYNLEKLQGTFQGTEEQDKFASWQSTHHLVVYDAQSEDKRDAHSAISMIKKFTNQGYTGSMNILRGGFKTFAASYPELVDHSAAALGGTGLTLSSSGAGRAGGSALAPVIGGVMLPMGSDAPNPFFNHIRQNQDLIGGVGQMKIGLPAELERGRLPSWLKDVADPTDEGKKVSEKFLQIELKEQTRMKDAYSVQTKGSENKVQISGIEKGGKNRYKDILPFEHARVRLEGRPEGSCDYVNASHIKATRSHKRYIASQGPLPATFEDFWSVIWDQDVRVIVMLTAESEGGQLKCHPYWQGREFGPIKLRSLSEKKVSLDIDKRRSNSMAAQGSTPTPGVTEDKSRRSSVASNSTQSDAAGRGRANTTTNFESSNPPTSQPHISHHSSSVGETPYVIIRKLALSHAAHPFAPMREITQLHYPSWPDFGAPAQPSHLLALVELANVMQRASLPLDLPATLTSVVSENGDEAPGTRQDIEKLADAASVSWQDTPESGEHARPMLVHCSAGCGRTGAFCTVDSVIDMLKRQRLSALVRQRAAQGRDSEGDIPMSDASPVSAARKLSDSFFPSSRGTDGSPAKKRRGSTVDDIDTSWLDDETLDLIAATVEDFRGQRLSMVQSLRQFVLCYETIIEWVWRVQQRGQSGSRGRSGSFVG